MKPAIRSTQAEADIQGALEYYFAEAPSVAEGFVAALERTVTQIERQPGIGSPRYGHELSIPMLRHWSLNRFPYLVFYIEHDDHSDMIRLVHMSRDIPASLA